MSRHGKVATDSLASILLCCMQIGNFDDAVKDYSKACDIMPWDKSYEASYKSAKSKESASQEKDLYQLLVRCSELWSSSAFREIRLQTVYRVFPVGPPPLR
eukprot:SAG31_NODE_271_length_18717_cov_8.685949_19_plen_101_part_00